MGDQKNGQEVKHFEADLTRLFGETSYQVEKRPCRGKYRGHNDYSLVFGSGRTLYIGIDRRNYIRGLREHLEHIRYFRNHQAEYTQKVRAAVLANDTPFADAAVDIMTSSLRCSSAANRIAPALPTTMASIKTACCPALIPIKRSCTQRCMGGVLAGRFCG